MGARYPFYLLSDSREGQLKGAELAGNAPSSQPVHGNIRHGFVYERVPHVTLKSIANNPEIREGMTREEIDAAIRKYADQETLYDQPEVDRSKARVTGPFTVEAVPAVTVRPIDDLDEPSAGDLSVELPTGGSGDLGYLTRAFNTLVSRLREKESHGELEKLSLTDALTGLYNRRYLMGTLASEIQRSRRLRRAFSVLLADVDRFKQYNDTHGHLAGDAALVKIAEVFRKTTRQVDCVARYGGEEFVVMLLEANLATAALVAERVRARVAEQDLGEGQLTVSIGVAEYPDGGDTPEELIATADAAMYKAKSGGRNQIVVAGTTEQRPRESSQERRTRRKREA